MEMLIYKLPLIVIVASPKWHSEQEVWPREFQICSCFWTPCLQVTGHAACAVRFWSLTWANACLRLYISLTVPDRRIVTIDHQ